MTIGAYNGWTPDLTLVCPLLHKYIAIANVKLVPVASHRCCIDVLLPLPEQP